ncbi:DUF2953 domain-containing protein [Ammonifex thiophilus]|uniref:DUF2953 domain-containing protein n=1 Tax=Ammonifex thiophilus TaxID=444093 RepID=A0A3D8P6T6_9THEO|nr:DUF2953 domain-containing protein [Ammonifex thiophilus]RDV83948.1 DUF2953 domain-containing protein [Ammonifex thiophilus]
MLKLWFLVLVAATVALTLKSRLRLQLDFSEGKEQSHFSLTVKAPAGIRLCRFVFPAGERKSEGFTPGNWRLLMKWLRLVKKLLPELQIEKCVWHTSVGTGEAASTGWLAGLLWAGQSFLLNYFLRPEKLNYETVVIPNFLARTWSTRFELTASVPLLKGLRLLRWLLHLYRGGRRDAGR